MSTKLIEIRITVSMPEEEFRRGSDEAIGALCEAAMERINPHLNGISEAMHAMHLEVTINE